MQETLSSTHETATGQCFRLGDLRIDPVAGLIQGPGGVEHVDPKVMAVFAALAGRSGELLTREELLAQIWPGRVVTDYVLSRCIYRLRRHLVIAGGDGSLHDLIETLPKRGYRLNGKWQAEDAGAGITTANRSGFRRVTTVTVLILALAVAWWAGGHMTGERIQPHRAGELPVIAILPFTDLSAGNDQEYFAHGVSEELLGKLARIPSLRVIAGSSAFALKHPNVDIYPMAGDINITHVLEGSVRKSGDRVRISAQLINVADNQYLWSDTYERELDVIYSPFRTMSP